MRSRLAIAGTDLTLHVVVLNHPANHSMDEKHMHVAIAVISGNCGVDWVVRVVDYSDEQVTRLRDLVHQLIHEKETAGAAFQSRQVVEDHFWSNIATPALLKDVRSWLGSVASKSMMG